MVNLSLVFIAGKKAIDTCSCHPEVFISGFHVKKFGENLSMLILNLNDINNRFNIIIILSRTLQL